MPPKQSPSDWDRFFGPRAQRRRGPLGVLVFTALAGVMIAALIIIGQLNYRTYSVRADQRNRLTITPQWATEYAKRTAAAIAANATPTPSSTPTAKPQLPVGVLVNGGNLRSGPQIAADNIVGQLTAADEVEVLETSPAVQPQWYRVRITKSGGTVKAGTEGWVSATLLAVTPVPTTSTGPAPAAQSATATPR